MTEPFRLRHVNQIVGGFILATLLALVAFMIYVMRVKEVFVSFLPYEMEIHQDDLDGLRQGTELYVLGHVAGRITKIEYVPQSTNLLVSMTIKETYRESLFEDSVVKLKRRFGVGEPYLEILRGPRSDRLLPTPSDGNPTRFAIFEPEKDRLDVVETQLTKARESIQKVADAMAPALDSIREAANSAKAEVNESVGPASRQLGEASTSVAKSADGMHRKLDETLSRLEETFVLLDQRLEQLGNTVATIEREAQSTTESMRDAAATFSDSIVQVKEEASAAMREFATASVKTQDVMDKGSDVLERGREVLEEGKEVMGDLKRETSELSGTAAKANDAAGGAREVVDGLKRHWLLRKYVKSNSPSKQAPSSGVR